MEAMIPLFLVSLVVGLVVGVLAGLLGIGGGMLGRIANKRMDNKAVEKLFIGLMGIIMAISLYNVWQYTFAV